MMNHLYLTPRLRLSMTAISPAGIDMLKVLALISMILDHANTLFLTKPLPELYALGRMAFPLFALVWAMNVNCNPDRYQQHASRLWIWALLTQPVFAWAFAGHYPWYALNILFVFAGVTQLLALSQRYGTAGLCAGIILLMLLAWPLTPASYGITGLILVTGLTLTQLQLPVRIRIMAIMVSTGALVCLNGASHLLIQPATALVFAILPTFILPVMALYSVRTVVSGARFIPRHFFYYAYAGHLFLFALMTRFI